MKVTSPLANLDIGIGEIRRHGHHLILRSAPASSVDAEISISATELLRTIGRVLTTSAGLVFVLGLPFLWMREKLTGAAGAAGVAPQRPDINKPW